GIREVAQHSFKKAHYTYKKLLETGKFKPLFDKPFFKEFAVVADRPVEELNAKLMEHGILGGYDLSKVNPELGNAVLIAVTENRTKEEIDRFVEIMGVE